MILNVDIFSMRVKNVITYQFYYKLIVAGSLGKMWAHKGAVTVGTQWTLITKRVKKNYNLKKKKFLKEIWSNELASTSQHQIVAWSEPECDTMLFLLL